MIAIGLTGGIASGKSTVAEAFAQRGITIIDADIAARAVVAPGSPGLAAVIGQFGPTLLRPDGQLDRAALRERIFADTDARQRLEALLHPEIRQWMRAQFDAAGGAYAIVAIPLLAESGRQHWPWLQRVLVVDAPEALQRQRLAARDGSSPAQIDQIIGAQATRAQRLALADDVLVNSAGRQHIDAVVDRLDRRYRAMADAA